MILGFTLGSVHWLQDGWTVQGQQDQTGGPIAVHVSKHGRVEPELPEVVLDLGSTGRWIPLNTRLVVEDPSPSCAISHQICPAPQNVIRRAQLHLGMEMVRVGEKLLQVVGGVLETCELQMVCGDRTSAGHGSEYFGESAVPQPGDKCTERAGGLVGINSLNEALHGQMDGGAETADAAPCSIRPGMQTTEVYAIRARSEARVRAWTYVLKWKRFIAHG